MHFKNLAILALTLTTLTACSAEPKHTNTSNAKDKPALNQNIYTQEQKASAENRLKFEEIKLTNDNKNFEGGAKLEDIKKIYGEPTNHEVIKAGNADLDNYTWEKKDATISIRLYKDSALAKSITKFAFDREIFVTKKEYDKITNGMSVEKVKDILGLPDNTSESLSSDKHQMQSAWTSNIKRPGNIIITFENHKVVKKVSNIF